VLDNAVVRWVLVAVAVLAIVGLIAYARGPHGTPGRSPDKQHETAPA
jgi:hypothetical protein